MRAGLGIGVCQLGIARRDRELVPLLQQRLTFTLEVWLVMHRDLRNSRRIRLMFDHLAAELRVYCGSGGGR